MRPSLFVLLVVSMLIPAACDDDEGDATTSTTGTDGAVTTLDEASAEFGALLSDVGTTTIDLDNAVASVDAPDVAAAWSDLQASIDAVVTDLRTGAVTESHASELEDDLDAFSSAVDDADPEVVDDLREPWNRLVASLEALLGDLGIG
jgi:hypothetical protein